MPEKTAQRRYCEAYLEKFREFEGKMPESARHERARRYAEAQKLHITAGEQREIDKWLDERFPERKRKAEEPREPGLFDVPHVE